MTRIISTTALPANRPASGATRREAAIAAGVVTGSSALALDMWRRQAATGKAIVHAADPLHVNVRGSLGVAAVGAAVGAGAIYWALGHASEERAQAVRDATVLGYVGVGAAATGLYRVWDRGHVFNPQTAATAKFYELLGYGMNWATVGATIGAGAAVVRPDVVLGATRHVVPLSHDR